MSESGFEHCEALNKKGKPCGAFRLRGGRFCAVHDPANCQAMEEARKRGGQATIRRAVETALAMREFSGSSDDVADLLTRTINQVRAGKIDTKVANSVGYLAQLLLRAQDMG